jgi:L-lactate dehydrogenase complex protein LldF
MESIYSDSFDQKSSEKALDMDHRKKINFNIGKYNAVVPKGKLQFNDLEKVRSQAKNIKWDPIRRTDHKARRKSVLGRR